MNAEALILTASHAVAVGDERSAIAAIKRAIGCPQLQPAQISSLVNLARGLDRNDLALAAAMCEPPSFASALLRLQLRLELGEAVADELAALTGASPAGGPVLLQLAGALQAEKRSREAIARLEVALRFSPDWIEGHQALSQLRWQDGEGQSAHLSYFDAISRLPEHEVLWASWLGAAKGMEDWSCFSRASSVARSKFPSSAVIAMVCADGFSEMGRTTDADRLFAALNKIDDPHFDGARMRHAMRNSRLDDAVAIGTRAIRTHGNGECWAWLAAAWRLRGDHRGDWFYRGNDLIRTLELKFSSQEMQQLTRLLRKLHQGSAHPLGQSPRGGTQTMGPLLKRKEPELRALRRRLHKAVNEYVRALPPHDTQHPFLGRTRRGFGFAGAWSVLLHKQGHHVPHIHSHGWISSALYIDIPEGLSSDTAKRGWLDVGVPPLPVDAPPGPLATIGPQQGRLALFPSLFWHGTRPFRQGERLTVAFDVIPR